MDNIHCRPVMPWMTVADRFLITSHKRSITFSNVWKASFLNPRLRIFFQICSIGFISGVYGGMKARVIRSGITKEADLCHIAPSNTNRIRSSGYALASSSRNTIMQSVLQYGRTRMMHTVLSLLKKISILLLRKLYYRQTTYCHP